MEPIVVNDQMAKEAWAVDHWVEEDLWSKNRAADAIHRERKKIPHRMCAHCFRRCCHHMDSTPIHGHKAFKKSKIVNGPKRKLAPNYDTTSDDEPAEPIATNAPEPIELADDRI
jgi:hypothetical protein